MRQVDRSKTELPSSLLSSAVRDARREIDEMLALPEERRKQRRVPYLFEVTRAEDVRKSLYQLFQGRCAYCESEVFETESASVNHFRPFKVAFEDEKSHSEYHYAWLAYDWRNLYLACQPCTRLKANRFPVNGARAPLLSSLDEIWRSENAILLDPCRDVPSKHLDFYWNGEVRGKTQRGAVTIDCLGLNRASLVSQRLSNFQDFLSALEKDVRQAYSIFSDRVGHWGALSALIARFATDFADSIGRTFNSRAHHFNQLIDLMDDATDDERMRAIAEARQDVPTELERHRSASSSASRSFDDEEEFVPRFDPMAAELVPKTIEIRNYKGIRELILEIPEYRSSKTGAPCLMLLGENATSKTSVLEAIAITLAGSIVSSRIVTTPSDLLRRKGEWALIDPDPVNVSIDFHGGRVPAEFSVDPIRLKIEGSRDAATYVLAYGSRRYFSKRRRKGPGKNISGLFDPIATISDPTGWLRHLRDDKFYPLARAVREILNLDKEDDLIRDANLGLCVLAKGQKIPLERMSEGYRSIFALAVDIMRQLLNFWPNLEEARGVVLIDEIETHLHPRWKMRVMGGFRRALPNVVFLVTTHDPLCLRGMDDGEVHVLLKNSDQEVEQLQDLPSVKGMRADQILTSDYFGLSSTADPETEAALAIYTSETDSSADDQVADVREYLSQIVGAESPALMLVEEAVRKYLEARERSDAGEISETKKSAIRAILKSLDESDQDPE